MQDWPVDPNWLVGAAQDKTIFFFWIESFRLFDDEGRSPKRNRKMYMHVPC